jgi:pyruvate formate lyase activating enzyme
MLETERSGTVVINVNGKNYSVPERIPLKDALSLIGCPPAEMPHGQGIFAPCEVGACFSCVVEVDGLIMPTCITGVKDGMRIRTSFPENYVPKRLISGFLAHSVGGVGTPWEIKGRGPIEVACFAGGCNFRCPQCQNWTTTYSGKGTPLTPQAAAFKLTRARRRFRVDRMALSGGECTLNRAWLKQCLIELKRLNPDESARLHVDTNGSVLMLDYIDELVDAGMTDIGIDLKAETVDTFQRVTGLNDSALSKKYMKNSWEAVRYVRKYFGGVVFLGVGVPYNKNLISLDEIEKIGKRLAAIDPGVQVCVLDYRAEFRSKILRPSAKEMRYVGRILKDTGLKTVLCQTALGHIKV